MIVHRIFAILATALLTAPCWAANVTVTASNYKFTPASVTINVGDTVTFTNAGGYHNVIADDDSFNNGAPSAEKWTFDHTYTSAGTFGYFCGPHGSPGNGMFGTVHVNATSTPSIALGGYLSGNWFNPDQSGHGFELEFTNQPSETAGQNTAIAYWYVYMPDGSGPNWIFAVGPYDSTASTVTLPAFTLAGARFPPLFDANALTQTDWGTLTFTFTDCNTGTASWNSGIGGYGSGSLPITRITSVAGTACPAP